MCDVSNRAYYLGKRRAKPDSTNASHVSNSSLSCDTIAPLGTLTMRDLIGRTLGHYSIVDKIGERREPFAMTAGIGDRNILRRPTSLSPAAKDRRRRRGDGF
jgi:hypothetical protein